MATHVPFSSGSFLLDGVWRWFDVIPVGPVHPCVHLHCSRSSWVLFTSAGLLIKLWFDSLIPVISWWCTLPLPLHWWCAPSSLLQWIWPAPSAVFLLLNDTHWGGILWAELEKVPNVRTRTFVRRKMSSKLCWGNHSKLAIISHLNSFSASNQAFVPQFYPQIRI